jgi:hypothetical protein
VKVLFLDVDGVLNSAAFLARVEGSFARGPDWVHMLDAEPCARLERVLAATGAKIVLSSSWRHHVDAGLMTVMLRRRGVEAAEVVDMTPHFVRVNNCNMQRSRCAEPLRRSTLIFAPDEYGERGHEIQRWLTLHPEVTEFAIVDDNSDMAHLRDRLVLTSWGTGMLDEHADALIATLGTVKPGGSPAVTP